MASMMNGYHYDMAKDGANQYAVKVNGYTMISRSNFASALSVYKYIEEGIDNSDSMDIVEVIKEYDAKSQSYTDEVVRSNEKNLSNRAS
jgi:sulfatase maturation enzyme AslB (radical SAM superfamily)